MTFKRIAFFGATGGCTLAALWRALDAGYHCRALVRNPEKLRSLLKERHLATASNLEIVRGDVTDVTAVAETLRFSNGPVDIILCGIGGGPALGFSLKYPLMLDNPRICTQGVKAIIEALGLLRKEETTKPASTPLFINISTVGVANTYREFPWLMVIFYRWLLNMPIEDKRIAHQALLQASIAPPATSDTKSRIPLVRFVSVRPSHLSDGVGKGMGQIRAGHRVNNGRAEIMGHSIDREAVGMWMFESFMKNEIREEWNNEAVTVTY